MTPDLRRFLEGYGDAFNRLDPVAVARHYAVPSVMATNEACAVWSDDEQILRNMEALCAHYRAQGFETATFVPDAVIDQRPRHAVVNLRWTVCYRGAESRSFHTTYNLRRETDGWRILVCTAYEE